MNKITMMDRVKEAFWLKGAGIPWNFCALMTMSAWSLFDPKMWWITIPAEAIYMVLVPGSGWVYKALMEKQKRNKLLEWESRKKKILDKISPVGRKRYYQLETLGQSITNITVQARKDGLSVDMEKLKTVSQLLWLALKLLASREIMVQNVKNNSKEALEIKIENLRKNREKEKDERLKGILDSTLDTMEKRLKTYDEVANRIKEIDLNLLRIEEQMPLLRNVAALEVQNGKGSVTKQIDNAQNSIDDTNEWMMSAKDLFAPLDDEFGEVPPDNVFIGITE